MGGNQVKAVIFDFDGTVADTFGIVVDIFLKRASKRHPKNAEHVNHLFSMPTEVMLKTLGISRWQLPFIVYYIKRAMSKQIDKVNPHDGIDAALRQLHSRGYKLWIVSSNSTKNIKRFLENNKLNEYFDAYWGDQGVLNKARTLKKVARKNGVDVGNCIYIGDETRDIAAARGANMRFIAVTWGYNNRQALQKAGAKVLVDRPEQLLGAIANLTAGAATNP